MRELIIIITVSATLMLLGVVSAIYGIKNIPDDYGAWGKGCTDAKGAFIYNFFGTGGMFMATFSGISFMIAVGKLAMLIISKYWI